MSSPFAIVDPGSFVLPYDYQLVKGLADRGDRVEFYGSTTRYNAAFLEAMRHLPGVVVHARALSGSVTGRARGLLGYIALLAALLWRAPRYALVNLQFSAFWPLELIALFWVRRRFVFTIHNAVPHGFAGLRHRPTQWLASLASSLVFVSEATRGDFARRYGESYLAKSSVLPLGLLPIAPGLGPQTYGEGGVPRSIVFWGTVKPYKGVDIFVDLAGSDGLRRRGLALEVHGAWSSGLRGLRDDLLQRGVLVEDAYLDESQLLALLGRDEIFLLPYHEASQSGALYSLLNHGRLFICADVGDLGAFMRRFELQGLLLKSRSASAVFDCLDYLEAHRESVAAAFTRAQQALRWGRLLAEGAPVYRSRDATIHC